jgi:NADH-quinone oxidoreductase subunit N
MISNTVIAILPFMIIAASPVAIMLALSFRRSHTLAYLLSLCGLAASLIALVAVSPLIPRQVTPLLFFDGYALFYMGLILAAGFVVTVLSFGYLKDRTGNPEEYYILLLLAVLGSSVLVVSSHFASFFIGLEILSVSLYGLIAYTRNELGIEAGVKYLVLAAVSAAFLLFGIALLYGETGTMDFSLLGSQLVSGNSGNLIVMTGLAMLVVGIGFKLAVAPFHMWTPDVYEGAPAPVTAFIATVSKGAMFALLLRYFVRVDIHGQSSLFAAFAFIAVVSMFAGNLLALMQNNVKRILAYSSIAHLGYLLVAFLAGGTMRVVAVTFYLVAYFITTLGAFGVVTVLSDRERDADDMDDYYGLAKRRPWLAGIFSAMLFSLAGIPLTAGFIGKFYVIAAGAGSALWVLVIALVINSAIGLFYYLRIIVAIYSQPAEAVSVGPSLSLTSGLVLVFLTILLIWLGVYPGPLLQTIHFMAGGL